MTTRENAVATNPLVALQAFGQSVWLDSISRDLVASGRLASLVARDGLRGVTSNPAIFEKALAGSPDYDAAMESFLSAHPGAHPVEIYEALAVEDIRGACDVLRTVYDASDGADGFVSLEVSPYLANDTRGTIAEGRRLHAAVARPNVMIKIPGTPTGMPAIETLVAEGIPVNVTLLFAVEAYETAARAWMTGLERALGAGRELPRIASVASFFVSRIDTLVDERLRREIERTRDESRRRALAALQGRAAVANARRAYALYRELVSSPRWQALASRGARPQRVLWASTSTKNPAYPKTIYVDELIGPDTVNTMPMETLDEFRAHGRPRAALTDNAAETLAEAEALLASLRDEAGIEIREVAGTLLAEGVTRFADPFDALLATIERKRVARLGARFARQSLAPGAGGEAFHAAMSAWRGAGNVRRLWARDASLWTGADESLWLGWLDLTGGARTDTAALRGLAGVLRAAGTKDAVLLGMGGSSLAPEVIDRVVGGQPGWPRLHVSDSTVPAQVRAIAERTGETDTVYIVASKSGGTVEPNVMKKYFHARVAASEAPAGSAGARFIAITDPGSSMEALARGEGFRHIAYGLPSVGGRFSALSSFGMLPAALIGIDVDDFLARAALMVAACGPSSPPETNPGVALGLFMGTLAKAGRDKLTFFMSPALRALGGWLEQLIAESTGKIGRGIVPVDGEMPAEPSRYGSDRVFVYITLAGGAGTGGADDATSRAVDALEAAGHPVARITVNHPSDLGAEFFRWEIATAVAGAVLGVNPFDQPDVEAAKVAARRLMESIAANGALPPETPVLSEDGIAYFADPALPGNPAGTGTELLRAHLARLEAGDYFAVQAYVAMNEANDRPLQVIRHAVRDARRVATTLGYGPRFLHSTGQLHKGGPATGLFLQVTSDDAPDLPIPGERATFGMLKAAQARGDFDVLAGRGRRILRAHLGADVSRGLEALAARVTEALR